MTRYTMLARLQGELYAQRAAAHLERDTHRWVFVRNLTPEVECDVRKWLLQRLSGLYCDLQLNNTPPLPSMAQGDEAVEVNARGLNALGTVIDEGAVPTPDYHVLWPGKPTTNTVWTAVEDYTWFEAFSEEGCAAGIACTPSTHTQSER